MEMSEATKGVTRYEFDHPVCSGYGCCGAGSVTPASEGDFVAYVDYLALTQRAEAAEAERDAARDKNIELHNRVRTYNNRAKKLGQKQKKNHKLATYAEESNELLRAERDALLVDRDYWKAEWALVMGVFGAPEPTS
jgi:hypothetical protein